MNGSAPQKKKRRAGPREFLEGVRTELRKCSWPDRQELLGSTWVVIVSVVILAVFVGVCDLVLMRAVEAFIALGS